MLKEANLNLNIESTKGRAHHSGGYGAYICAITNKYI